MKTHRFITSFIKEGSTIKIVNLEIFHQLKKVLKIKPGESVILSEGNGTDFLSKLTIFGKDFVEFEVLEERDNQNEPRRKIFLFAAILKRENFEFIIQKGTETGVEEFFPIITERTVKFALKLDRLRKIAKEAAEQSERSRVPKVHPPLSFGDALEKSKEISTPLVLERGGKFLFESAPDLKGLESLSLLIGPEGGWTTRELQEFEKNHYPLIDLGSRTLRAETSAIVASWYLASFQ
ncbi:MAG: 16S rRNA (uracil1498-N3)-methyltransferase [Parcubacteria group bacterium Gr01-1014_20]|nr:MAG: 16S rRNA (uracil1498-N3)-methyltransferase [Parcubacteria group bacterium Gr01-1014_20]